MLLRKLSLQPGQPLIVSPGQSFGRFTGAQDDLALHPAGYAVALSQDTCKLQILKFGGLAADARPRPPPSWPARAAGRGCSSPVAVACSLDKIMVLQVAPGNPQGCVCAFDVKGNPVFTFAGGASVMGLRPEAGDGLGRRPQHRAQGVPVHAEVPDTRVRVRGRCWPATTGSTSTTPTAASWPRCPGWPRRGCTSTCGGNCYALNYEILAGSGRTEPSVAKWIPSTPNVHVTRPGGKLTSCNPSTAGTSTARTRA